MEKKSYKSWTISDVFWEVVKDEIPERQRAKDNVYKRKLGDVRKALSKRRVADLFLRALPAASKVFGTSKIS